MSTMSYTLLLADSELAGIEPVPQGLRLRLAAAHALRAAGPHEARATPGYFAGGVVVLLLEGARLPPDCEAGALLGRVQDARLRCGPDQAWRQARLPLPGRIPGQGEAIGLELQLHGAPLLLLQGWALQCSVALTDLDAAFRESLAC